MEEKAKVEAIWTVGYPAGKDRKIYNNGDKFTCDYAWAKRKAEQNKVKIIKVIEKAKRENKGININNFKTRDDFTFIEECKDKDQLKTWIKQEVEGQNRKTIVTMLEERLNVLEEG